MFLGGYRDKVCRDQLAAVFVCYTEGLIGCAAVGKQYLAVVILYVLKIPVFDILYRVIGADPHKHYDHSHHRAANAHYSPEL